MSQSHIKSAFDSVDRVALWKALQGSGMPPFLLQLIRDLHTGTTARVRTPQGMSDVFYTTSGVRQGCILAPELASMDSSQKLIDYQLTELSVADVEGY